jgi:predicted ester cyclase
MDRPTGSPAGAPAAQADEALVRQFYVPFNTGEVGIYERILDVDWVDDPLAPGQRPGRAGMGPHVAGIRQVIPDYHTVIDDLIVVGDKAAVRSTVRGTHTEPFFGIPPTGRQVSFRTFDFHQIARGVIVATWHLEDFFGLFQQLGAFPAQRRG